MVPHLITALDGPLNELEQHLLDAAPVIERWFRLEWMEHTPPLYSAVDIRNAGFKVAPVNTDLCPKYWHLLSADTLPMAVQAAQAAIEKICPQARQLMIVPENGPPSAGYLANLARLQEILSMAGLSVRLGSVDPALTEPTQHVLADGHALLFEPVQRENQRVGLAHFDPCTVLLNHELAAGVPGILEDLREQFLLPPLHAGLSVRRKSLHYQSYENLSKRFAKLLGIDPWLIAPLFATCGEVEYLKNCDNECVRDQVDALLAKIRRKYREYGINEKPFVVIKTDQGSTGMGLMTVRDPAELDQISCAHVLAQHPDQNLQGEVIIQEGILTNERVDESVAEPVVHLIDRYVVGGYYRVHADQGPDEGLKAPGARFMPLPFDSQAHLPHHQQHHRSAPPNRFYMYGVVARLAMAAASHELEASELAPEAGHAPS